MKILNLLILVSLLLLSCVTNYPKQVMDPPWVPEETAVSNEYPIPDQNTFFNVYYSEESKPKIDGDFSEWEGLEGVRTQLAVYGGQHNPEDAEVFVVLRTDGINLYIYNVVTDDLTHENFLPGSMAWRSDTPEVFFGTNTTNHKNYTTGDNQIRIVPRSKQDMMDVDIVINQRTANSALLGNQPGALLSAATIYNDEGYVIEASVPLSMMNIKTLRPGQKVRGDFQINDADETERDRMIHWISDKDTPWFDPSVWGNGIVVDLP